MRYRRHDANVFPYAFDLIELNGDDLRRDPLEERKATLASILPNTAPVSVSMSTLSTRTVRSCFATPASSAWKASRGRGRTRSIAPTARLVGFKTKNPACAPDVSSGDRP